MAGGVTTTFWTLADHEGTVRDIVSGTGASLGQVVEHRQYDSFGKILKRTAGATAGAALLSGSGVGVAFGFAGRPLEERTGLSDNRARWYDPAVGRFASEDPSGFKGGDANLFGYVGNDPLNRVDPSGLTAAWASYAGKTSAAAGAWASIGQGGLTPSAAGSSRIGASTPIPMLSLAASTQPRVATAQPMPYASLTTTGRTAPQSPMPQSITARSSDCWTERDREAALRADMAYAFNQGGLLKDLKVGYEPDDSKNAFTRTGLSAMLTRSPFNGRYYLAFRGTGPSDGRDVLTDLVQASGFRTAQHEKAIALARLVQAKLGPNIELTLTGHSLGGGLAAAAAYATGLSAIVFNPASLNATYSQGNSGSIRSHIIVGDLLSIGRTIQNIFRDSWDPALTAPGKIILHSPRTIDPTKWHGMASFPDY